MGTQNISGHLNLSLLNVDECCAENWNFRKVISPFSRMYLVKSGEGSIVHNHKKYELQAGKLYMVPGFTLCNYSSPSFLEHYYIHFIPQILGETARLDALDFEYEVIATEEDIRMMKRIAELNPGRKLQNVDPRKYCKDNLLPQTETLDSALSFVSYLETQGMLLQLFSRFIKTDGQNADIKKFTPNKKISNAVDFIHQNLGRPIQVNELADSCHFSNDYFSRLFLKIMGTRPIDYINRKRIESAQLQLITSNDPIEKIALESGIDNFSYFNRTFKKYSCATPGEYRKLHQLV